MNDAPVTTVDPTRTWEAKTIPVPRQLLGCRISSCGEYVVAGDFAGAIHRWHLASDRHTVLAAHSSWVKALVFHADRRRLYSTDYAGTICCWNYADEEPQPIWTLRDAHEGWIRDAVVAGDLLVTAGNDARIRVWSANNGSLLRELTGHGCAIFCLAVHPDGRTLASGDNHGVIKRWDLTTGRHERDLNAATLWHSPEATMSLTGVGGVRSLAFDRDGATLVAGGMATTTSANFAQGTPAVLAYDWAAGSARPSLRIPDPFEGFITSLAFHPDGFLIGAGGGVGGALWFWRAGEQDPFASLRGLRHLRETHLHPDGQRLIAATFEARGQGGNGRRGNIAEYVDNAGAVKIYSMTPRPSPPRR